MIYGLTHPGSGVGNQLHRYIATRVLALDKGYDFSMIGSEFSKVKSFMNLDMGIKADVKYHIEYPAGKLIVDDDFLDFNEETNYYNPEFNFIEDNTIIDGEFQDQRYFWHRLSDINEWLKVEPIDIPYDVCVIGFRGGEFYVFPELGLPKEYFEQGIKFMQALNPNMKFEVHTDDIVLAKKFFPDYKVIHDVGINWRSMRYAKYALIANSSFYILPRLLRQKFCDCMNPSSCVGGAITIAPRYWARRNTGEWSMPQNYYESFQYI